MKVSIVIPAYNEQNRIERTLRAYQAFFNGKKNSGELDYEIVVVLNGCRDHTLEVVERVRNHANTDAIIILNLIEAGKGLAIKTGFVNALTRNSDLIGFVDADMATKPEYFYDLIKKIDGYEGVIASRYMPGAHISPSRPLWKRWGSRIFYESLIKLLFGLSYYDYQCGAKIFRHTVIEKIVPHLTVRGWGFDIELLYLCKKNGYKIKEVPTVWEDQTESKLTLRGGLRMLVDLFKLRFTHL